MSLVAAGSDPDGDRITFTWRAWRGTGTTGTTVNTKAGANSSERSLTWPATTPQLTVEVTATDRRGLSAARRFVFGAPLAPIQLNITGTVAAAPIGASTPTATAGAAVSLTVSSNRAPSGGITWSLASGPAIPGVTFPRSGATLTFAAPTVTTAGQQLVVRADRGRRNRNGQRRADVRAHAGSAAVGGARRVAGNRRAAGARLRVARLPPARARPAGRTDVSASATATGTGALSYAWSTSPAMTIRRSDIGVHDDDRADHRRVRHRQGPRHRCDRRVGGSEPTRPGRVGLTDHRSHVRRWFGHERSHPPGPRQRQSRVGGLLDVSVPLGLPPIGKVNLGKITFSGDCTTDPAISFSGAAITIVQRLPRRHGAHRHRLDRPGVLQRRTGHSSGRTGPRHRHGGHTSEPVVRVARPDGLDSARPAVAHAEPSRRQRTAAHRPRHDAARPGPVPVADHHLSPLASHPSRGRSTGPAPSRASASAGVVPKQTTARFDCGFIELTSTASTPWGDLALRGLARRDGSFDAAVVTKGLRLFGKTTNTDLTGTLRSFGHRVDHVARSAPTSAPRHLGTDAVTHPDAARAARHFRLSPCPPPDSCTSGGTGPVVDVALTGTITGQDEFTATLTGSLAAPWQPLPGLNIGGRLNHRVHRTRRRGDDVRRGAGRERRLATIRPAAVGPPTDRTPVESRRRRATARSPPGDVGGAHRLRPASTSAHPRP